MRIDAARERFGELPLASKCLVLFGLASALIIAIALSLPLLRMNGLVEAGQRDQSRSLMSAWNVLGGESALGDQAEFGGVRIRAFAMDDAREASRGSAFLARAVRAFERRADRGEYFGRSWSGLSRNYQYAVARRTDGGELTGMVMLERSGGNAAWLLGVNLLYVTAAGFVVLAVALVVFAVITNKLILEPVESLKRSAERVRQGHLDTRSDIETGDEFEELAETFNLMLSELEQGQAQLRATNTAMEMKVSELGEANQALAEAARLKGEFLASVSHELRTPLNSIIGFAELLLEICRTELAEGQESGVDQSSDEGLQKRERYLVNIVTAGRNLLEMIESLLEMAKLEAGRVEVDVQSVNLVDACQGLVGLIHPLARRKGIKVIVDAGADVPLIQTDIKKLHQIVFNLLSNAVKFTGEGGSGGEITLRAERLAPTSDGEQVRVRISVIDTGPGIAPEDQQRIFEKFQQVEGGHTRGHAGTGLGLAIVRELTAVLQGEIQLVSEIGRGSMFSLILPLELDERRLEEYRLASRFSSPQGAAAG